jgi:hypothetical protein
MAIDLNEAEEQRPIAGEHRLRYDEAAIARDLAATANRWAPEIFAHGRISADRTEIRCADITGRPPRNRGSCVIKLTGEHAGEWCDFSGGRGGPLSTIKEHFQFADGEVFDRAIEILRGVGFNRPYVIGRPNGAVNGHAVEMPQPRPQPTPPAQSPAADPEVAFRLSGCVPYRGTVAETYVINRAGIAPDAPDLHYHPALSRNRREAKGFDALVSQFRWPNGELSGGIHEEYLKPDGSHHIGGDKPKMMRGKGLCSGAVIMLMPLDPAAATLAIGEGIASALAGSRYFNNVPVWAAASDGNLKKFGEFLKGSGGMVAAGPDKPMIRLRQLLIFGDRGEGGERNGWALYRAARTLGIAVELYLPTGPDDLCDDLANGRPAPQPQPEPEESRKRSELPPREGLLPSIRLGGGRLSENIGLAERYAAEFDKDIYQFGDALVRPGLEIVDLAHNRKGFASRLISIGIQHLTDRLTAKINFERFDARSGEWHPADCPANIAAGLLDRTGGLRPSIRYVRGIISAPTLRPDGSLLIAPGYDEAMSVILEPGETNFDDFGVPERPTKDQGRRALDILSELISEFPFLDEAGNAAVAIASASRSVVLSHALAAAIRLSLDRTPLHAYDATAPGTGKSLLVDTVALIATGHECPVISQGGSEEELEKRLGAALLSGDALISFDNCERPLGGEKLNSALSQRSIRVRVLGTSKQPAIPSEAIFSATGNNLRLIGDMGRRSILARLDPQMERPELRVFRTENPVKRVRGNRALYVAACLVVLRAYEAAGRPKQCDPLGSFEEWSNRVRSAILWLGEPDPVMTMERTREIDPRRQERAAVLYGWQQAIGEGIEVTGRRLIEAASEATALDFNRAPFKWPDFREALLAVGGERGVFNSRKLGYWLRANKGAVIDNLRIEEGKLYAGERRWKLVRLH